MLRGVLADRPQFTRVGVICHRPHVASVKALNGEFNERLVKVAYFGSGEDRSSNEWHTRCDLIVVAGTPRIRTAVVAAHLIQVGEIGAACREPQWGTLYWQGETETGQPIKVKGAGYQDERWRCAHRDLVRAQLVQAIGRGRGVLESGCEVLVLSNEECGLPVSEAKPELLNDSSIAILNAVRRLTMENANKEFIGNSIVRTDQIANRR